MLAKIWKKLGVIILIIACLFNITIKLVKKIPLKQELIYSVQYLLNYKENNSK